ncbi:sterol desaturase family protein [Oxalobacteraceae bacterium]|nr:sterol desaturase family protein [Oxalobacteraceae bacterium]
MEFLSQLQQQLPPFAFDLIKFTNGLILLAVLLIPLERLFALHPQRLLRKGLARDLGYYFLTSLLPNRLIALPIAMLVLGLNYLVPPGLHGWVAGWPLWLRFPCALLVAELGFYWGHRWMHEVSWMWRFHAVHHGAASMDWLVNSRAHPIDLVFMRLCGFVPLYLTGLAQPSGVTLDWVPLLVALIGSMWGYFIHANVRWRLGWIEQIVSTPAFHHWHHNNTGPEHRHMNYAPMFPVFDRLFGTYYLDKKNWPSAYGIDEAMDDDLLGQLLHPFSPAAASPSAQREREQP